MLYQKCLNLQPRDSSHKSDLNKVTKLLAQFEQFNEYFADGKYEKAEELAATILLSCPEFKDIKLKYIECMMKNNKLQEALSFLEKKVSAEDRYEEDYQYLICLILYYQGT